MCALCRAHLILEDDNKKLTAGEKAHVIGHGAKGPRREQQTTAGIKDEDIDSLTNLILLCFACHLKIDGNPDKYPAEWLFKKKHEHEAWVKRQLATLKESVAVIHKTMKSPIDHILLADQLERQFVERIDWQEALEPSTADDWASASSRNKCFAQEIVAAKGRYDGADVSILPLSQIPLLIQLGVLLSDTIPLEIYQYDREGKHWVGNAPPEKSDRIQQADILHDLVAKGSKALVVTVTVTMPIHIDDVAAVVDLDHADHLDIRLKDPGMDRVLYREDVNYFASIFKRQVEQALGQARYDEVHLFYSGPAGLAVRMGQAINTNMWPKVNLYHFRYRETPRYQHALTV